MKVSIIVPVYNVEKYIKKCIDSLINQTLFDIEILLIDDGSTDSSGVICDEYATENQAIKVIHKNNGGVSSARNIGLDNATGEYVGFVDPDDWCEPEMFEKMYEAAKSNGCGLVICGYCVDHDNNAINRKEEPEIEGVVSGYEALYQCLRGQGHGCFTAMWNKLIKKDVIKSIRFNSDYIISEDELFLCGIIQNVKKAYIIKKTYYHWYQSKGSAIRSNDDFVNKWETSYEAKIKIPEIIKNEKCIKLAKANVYATLLSAVWTLYYFKSKDKCNTFLHKIIPYRKDFLRNEEFSLKKKIRYEIILFLIKVRAPRKLVYSLGKLTSVEINNIFK